MSIILAQFTRKGFSDGMEGMVRVFEENPKMVVGGCVSIGHRKLLHELPVL